MSVILTTFAGRRGNLKLLFHYVNQLLAKGSITEFHVWNYTRDTIVDEPWLKRNIIQDPRVKLFEVKNKKSWDEYYSYYTQSKFDPTDVIVKCDDDIVFIDTEKFDSFIQKKRTMVDYPLAFASIVNNRTCAFVQRMYGFWPPEEFTDDILTRLWSNTTVCEFMHQMFIDSFEHFLTFSRKAPHYVLDPVEHVNINFFAILGKDLGIFQEIKDQPDEDFLSQQTGIHYIDMSLVVVHLAFSPQRCDGFNDELFQTKYTILKDRYAKYISTNGGSDCQDDRG
jgi:hypothetical protein